MHNSIDNKMYFFKAGMILLAITLLAIQGSEALRCYQCRYTEGDADERCLLGDPSASVEIPGPPSLGYQSVCTLELKTKDGRRFVSRSYREIDEELYPEIQIDSPIEYTLNPEENYIRFRACSYDNCNYLAYSPPPKLNPVTDIKCYKCIDCEIFPSNLTAIPRIPNAYNSPTAKRHLEIGSKTNSSSNAVVQYTSEPVGAFGWEAYCEITWTYNEEGKRQIYRRDVEWFHKDVSGNMDRKCRRIGSKFEYCYCTGDGCNNYVPPGLQCYDCVSTIDGSCEINPELTKLKFNLEDWLPPGMKYVCTVEAKYSAGVLIVIRGSQVVNDTEEAHQCIAGPMEGPTKNPEKDYITLCSCDGDRCNNNVTFSKPPKLPSPIKCYECRMSEDPGCDNPDPRYLKEIPAIPGYLSSVTAAAAGNRSSERINSLTPSEPIGKFSYVPYCLTSYSDDLEGIASRGVLHYYEPEPDNLGGTCIRQESYGSTTCYCQQDGCNSQRNDPSLECYDCEYNDGDAITDCKVNPTKIFKSLAAPPGFQYVCTLEARYEEGKLNVKRSTLLIEESEEPNKCIQGPIEGQYQNPELDYITVCSCKGDRCNSNVTFEQPPKLTSPINCFVCGVDADLGCIVPDPKYLKAIPAIPDILIPTTRKNLSLNDLEPTWPIGQFQHVAYCRTVYALGGGVEARGAEHFYEPREENMDGVCTVDPLESTETCYCRQDGCNGNRKDGQILECYECDYNDGDASVECRSNPQKVHLSLSAPAGMQYVCTVEARYEGGKLNVKRSTQLVAETEEANKCIQGPIEGKDKNPELDYITVCSCDTDRCNQNVTFELPPKLPPPIKCFVCGINSDPGCDVPDSRYLKEIPAIPDSLVPTTRRKNLTLNELMPSVPIAPFQHVAYCRNVFSDALGEGLESRGAEYFYTPEDGDWDGKCRRNEAEGRKSCYCSKDGCNKNKEDVSGRTCYDCEYKDGDASTDCRSNPQKILQSLNPSPGMKYVCTLETRFEGGKLNVKRSTQLVAESEESNKCIQGPIQGRDKNPELDYLTLCSCNTDKCNGGVSYEKPPKLPSPLKCFVCEIEKDSGCEVPDSKYLQDIPAIPDSLKTATGRNLSLNELHPSVPIGPFEHAVYCRTVYSDTVGGPVESRGTEYFYEPTDGNVDGVCRRNEREGRDTCYCRQDGCNGSNALVMTWSLMVITLGIGGFLKTQLITSNY